MTSWKRVVGVCVLAVVTVGFLTAEACLYTVNHRTQLKAEALLSSLRQLRLNESTLSDTEEIRSDYHASQDLNVAQPGVEQSYHMTVFNQRLNEFIFRHHWLWWLGAKPYGTVAYLKFRNGKLNFVGYSFVVGGTSLRTKLTEIQGEVALGEESQYDENFHIAVGSPARPAPEPWRRMVLIRATLNGKATDQELRTGFDFDLSCISSFRNCQTPCEIMPSLWKEALRRARNKEMSVPEELLQNPRCLER